MQKTKLFIIIVVIIFIAGSIYLATMCFLSGTELARIRQQLKAQETNEKVLLFAQLFVDKILLSDGTVNFEDRLKLENAVRDINDKEIFSEWEKFTKSQNDRESQSAVGNLFKFLLSEIYK